MPRLMLIEVKVECHQCQKFRVRSGLNDEYDADDLAATAVKQLNQVDGCPHTMNQMEVTVQESLDRTKRKKVRYV